MRVFCVHSFSAMTSVGFIKLVYICWWFSPGTPISSTNKIECHYVIEILLKVALNTSISNSHIKKQRLIISVTSIKLDKINNFWLFFQ